MVHTSMQAHDDVDPPKRTLFTGPTFIIQRIHTPNDALLEFVGVEHLALSVRMTRCIYAQRNPGSMVQGIRERGCCSHLVLLSTRCFT